MGTWYQNLECLVRIVGTILKQMLQLRRMCDTSFGAPLKTVGGNVGQEAATPRVEWVGGGR